MKSLMKHDDDLLGQVVLTQNSRVKGFLFRVFKDNKTSWLRQRDKRQKGKDSLTWTLKNCSKIMVFVNSDLFTEPITGSIHTVKTL